jgi:hypothetical protein
MRLRLPIFLSIPVLVFVTACGVQPEDDAAGVTPGEAAALNDAAAMLDANAIEPILIAPAPTK